jgi:PAS domain S-box-containing protein
VDLDELYRVMRLAHVRAQGIFDTVRDPLLVLDGELNVLTANPAFYKAFGVGRDETIGRPLYELGSGQWDVEDLRRLMEDVIPKSASIIDYEIRADFPTIGQRTMLVSAQRLVQPDNGGRVLLLTLVDATERQRREREQDIMIGELQHRMKNLLALTQALARQTEAKGRSGEEYRDAFLGRFEALVASLEASSSGQTTDLSELTGRTLEPYATGGTAIQVEKETTVPLKGRQALAIGRILHELATNAIKHGALSAHGGCVRIGWEVGSGGEDAPHVHLWWRETGGPTVSPPTRQGFGTRLIEFAAARELGGEAELEYAPEGLLARVSFPL